MCVGGGLATEGCDVNVFSDLLLIFIVFLRFCWFSLDRKEETTGGCWGRAGD